MRLRSAVPALLCVLALAASVASADEARLVLLHTTDLHGALTGFDYLADKPAARGLTRIAPLVRAVRAEGAPVVLVDDGDALQGGPLVTVYQRGDRALPEPMTAAMTRMGYDALAVGNHEFSYGPDALAKARAAAGFPWLAANVVRASDGTPAFGTSVVKTYGAVRVGIVGVTTPAIGALEDAANIGGLRFTSPVDAANAEIARLRAAKAVDVVVLLAHTGLEKDPVTGVERSGDAPGENWGLRLAQEVKGADVLVLGHTHAVVASTPVGGVLVTQAGTRGENLGRVDITLQRADPKGAWTVADKRARVIAIADSMPEDSALAAFAKPYHEATRVALDQAIGEAAADIDAPHGRDAPGPLWSLIHRAMREASGADVTLAPLFDPRARIAKGPIRMRDVMRLYPYDNTLVTVKMTLAQLRDALMQSARYWTPYTFEDGKPLSDGKLPGYQCDMAEGVTYAIDPTLPPDQRIGPVLLIRGGEVQRPGAPGKVDDRLSVWQGKDTVTVAVSSYRANGGGGFEMIRTAPRVSVGHTDIRDLLVETVTRAHRLEGESNGRWDLIPAYALARERPAIDLLVRRGALAREDARALDPRSPATAAEVSGLVAKAFGLPSTRNLLPGPATFESTRDALTAAAHKVGYALKGPADLASFQRALVTGTDARPGSPLTEVQALAMLANARYPRIRVLETTDFHGAILGGSRERRTNRPIGGSAVLAAHIERLRAENPEGTVLLDGGDCMQGTMVSNLQFGRPVFEQMNALRYTAFAVGNHDFDWSADTLSRRIGELECAALGANMIVRRTGKTPRDVRSDTAFVRRGVKVGVLGLCYRYTPSVTLASNVTHLRFEDDSVWAARLAPLLRKRDKATVVLSVGHTPAETDSTKRAVSGDLPRMARGIRGVDAWFGGHSHNQVLDEIGGSPVLISGSQGQIVGCVDLVVDPIAGKVVEHRARLVTTYADEVKPDSAWLARVARWNAATGPIAATPVGRSARRITRGSPESAVGDLVADAMRAATSSEVAFQNTGGLRADLPEGPLTKGSIYEVMPFDNTMTTVTLTGAEVRKVIEEGLTYGRVTQVSGIRFTYDPDGPDGDRVRSITLADGSPLDPAKDYRAVCNNFMATGGDNYFTLSKGRDKRDGGETVRDALERHVRKLCENGAALDVTPDGRIQRVKK
jgi:2',3'-cyclic-nucleotide 2'-phosphodiesterase / 3'-nucleotidase